MQKRATSTRGFAASLLLAAAGCGGSVTNASGGLITAGPATVAAVAKMSSRYSRWLKGRPSFVRSGRAVGTTPLLKSLAVSELRWRR